MKYFFIPIIIAVFINNIKAQDTLPCDKKVVKYVRTIITECINLDSVEEFLVDEYSTNVTFTTKWQKKNLLRVDTVYLLKDSMIVEEYASINKIEDSIFIYHNLMQINVTDYNILPIFPKSISKLPNLSGIYNNGIISDKTFESVPSLPMLMGITIGAVTDSLTKVPKILTSKKLQEVEILYLGEGDKIILKILRKMLKKKNIKRIDIIPVHGTKLSKVMIEELSKLQLKYERKNKKLVFY